MSYTDKYIDTAIEQLRRLQKEQGENIKTTAQHLYETVQNGGFVYVFGCTHAGILSQEAFYRTGGLVVVNPIMAPGLTCDVVPITHTSSTERIEGYGKIIANSANLKKGDMLIVHSVSGRNSVPVELAEEAMKRGVYVVAITNMDYSSKSTPRHSNGKMLYECCDLVIDDCGIFGDAAIQVEGFPGYVSPTSTITGCAVINAICAETVALYVEAGIEPPVFMSANVDGGDEYNKRIMDKYKAQIKYMG